MTSLKDVITRLPVMVRTYFVASLETFSDFIFCIGWQCIGTNNDIKLSIEKNELTRIVNEGDLCN